MPNGRYSGQNRIRLVKVRTAAPASAACPHAPVTVSLTKRYASTAASSKRTMRSVGPMLGVMMQVLKWSDGRKVKRQLLAWGDGCQIVCGETESARVARRSARDLAGGRLTSQKPARCRGRTFFAPFPSGSSELGRPSRTQKSQRVGAGFSLLRRDRDSNSGTKRIGHSLAGCCITTLPPLQ